MPAKRPYRFVQQPIKSSSSPHQYMRSTFHDLITAGLSRLMSALPPAAFFAIFVSSVAMGGVASSPSESASPFVVEAANLPLLRTKDNAHVMDVACGSGRHTEYFLKRGCRVTAIDRDISGVEHLKAQYPEMLTLIQADLEKDPSGHHDYSWPEQAKGPFDAVVVTNYLHRPLFPHMAKALKSGGALIYETYAQGNEKYGKPSNPNFLLAEGELLDIAKANKLSVLKYNYGYFPIKQGDKTKGTMREMACLVLDYSIPSPP